LSQNDVFPHNQVAADYLWAFFTNYAEGDEEISVSQFTAAAEKIYAQITDKEQIRLYVQVSPLELLCPFSHSNSIELNWAQ